MDSVIFLCNNEVHDIRSENDVYVVVKNACLSRVRSDLHMVQQMPLPLTISCSSKSRLVLPFRYQLTRVVPDKFHKSCKTIVVIV